MLIHVVAVPGFVIGLVGGLLAIGFDLVELGLYGFVLTVVSFAAQGLGHKFEKEPPIPFEGAGDAVSRIITEQFVTFWRYVLSGQWLAAILKRS
jgi:hypothetical protein